MRCLEFNAPFLIATVSGVAIAIFVSAFWSYCSLHVFLRTIQRVYCVRMRMRLAAGADDQVDGWPQALVRGMALNLKLKRPCRKFVILFTLAAWVADDSLDLDHDCWSTVAYLLIDSPAGQSVYGTAPHAVDEVDGWCSSRWHCLPSLPVHVRDGLTCLY